MITLIGLLLVLLRAVSKGYITVETAAVIMVAATFLLAVLRRTLARFILLLIPIYFFAREYGLMKPADLMNFLLALAPVIVVLIGLCVMFRGFFGK